MSGEQLCKSLEQLGFAKIGELCGSDIDWVFTGTDATSITSFCDWFCNNVNSTDVFTQEELDQYAELEANEEVLHGVQLDAMAACFANINPLLPNDTSRASHWAGLNMINTSKSQQLQDHDEIAKLEKQLNRLNLRKDQLSVQNISASGELAELISSAKDEQASIVQHQKAAVSAAEEHAQTLRKLADATDKLADIFYTMHKEESGFLVSADLSSWQQQEKLYTQALKQFLKKQFPSGHVNTLAGYGSDDGVEELVRGVGEATFTERTTDLHRLRLLIEEQERCAAAEEIRGARCRAEAEEAARALERVKRGYYAVHNTSVESSSAVRAEVARHETVLDALLEVTSRQHVRPVIAASHNVKTARQQYYAEKQQQVLSCLLGQLSRLDYVHVLVQCEGASVSAGVQQLMQGQAVCTLHHQRAQHRTAYLRELQHCASEQRALGTLPAHWRPLMDLLHIPQDPAPPGDLCYSTMADSTLFSAAHHQSQVVLCTGGLEQLVTEVKGAQHQLAGLQQPYTHRINALWRKCGLLEECLCVGGGVGVPASLPSSWLPPDLLDAREDLDARARTLKRDMMALLKQYEEKKKILLAQPELEDQLSAWATVKCEQSLGTLQPADRYYKQRRLSVSIT